MAYKIKANRYEKTRAGAMAYVTGSVPPDMAKNGEAWCGMVDGVGSALWQADGRVTPGVDGPNDLVDHWPREIAVDCVLGIFADGFTMQFPSKKEAKQYPRPDLFAVVPFKWKGKRDTDSDDPA